MNNPAPNEIVLVERDWKTRLFYLLFTKDTEHTRFFLAISALFCAVQLTFVPTTFDQDETYKLMRVVAEEWMWAITYLGLFLVSMYSILKGINNKWLRKIEPILSFIVWTASAVCMSLADFPHSMAESPIIVTAFMSWWLLLKVQIHE